MRDSMELYPATAAERAMKLQEALLRGTLGKVKWWQPVELIGKFEMELARELAWSKFEAL